MPASSADSFSPIEQALQTSLGVASQSSGDIENGDASLGFEEKLISSAKKVLLTKIEFQSAEVTGYSLALKGLKAKYIPLNSTSNGNGNSESGTAKNNVTEVNGGGYGHLSGNTSNSEPEDGIPSPNVMIHPPEKVILGWQRIYRIGAGLANLGNTCFLNAILQCLTYTPPLVNHLIEFDEHVTNCKTAGFCMMCELYRHIRRALEKNGETIKPQCILQKLKAIAKHMVWGRQEDAHEFLRYVMESMIKSSLKGYSPSTLDRISLETTVVNHIFGGYHRSQVICLRCKEKSDTYDHFMDIILDIKNVPSLEKALEKFVQPEILDKENAYMCPRCKRKCAAQKRFTVHRASNIATFQLKRFDYNRMIGGKITKHVTFPEKLDLRPYMSQRLSSPVKYQLYAVLVHQGVSCNSGHYFCFVRNSNNLWYVMDDCKVRQVSLTFVLSQQAYLLFYTRVANNSPYVSKSPTPATCNSAMRSSPATIVLNGKSTAHEPIDSLSHGVLGSLNANAKMKTVSMLATASVGRVPTPLPMNRDKVSFGIKPLGQASSMSSTQSKFGSPGTEVDDSKHPRIVMHIKNGRVTTNCAAAEAAAAAAASTATTLVNPSTQNRVANLVPYIPDSSEESDQENRNRNDVAGVPVGTDHANGIESLDASNPLAVITSGVGGKVKATSTWVVTDGCQQSPSVASDCSNNSVNSTTDWMVTDRERKNHKNRSNGNGERLFPRWLVTPTDDHDKTNVGSTPKRLPNRLLGGKERGGTPTLASQRFYDDDLDLLNPQRRQVSSGNRAHSDTEMSQRCRQKTKSDGVNGKPSIVEGNGRCIPEMKRDGDAASEMFKNGGATCGRQSIEERVPSLGDETNGRPVKSRCNGDAEHHSQHLSDQKDGDGLTNGLPDDGMAKKHRKRRRHRHKEDDGNDDGARSVDGNSSSNDESTAHARNKKRRRKPKRRHDDDDRYRRSRSRGSSDESSSTSYELEWVERTKETVEEERQRSCSLSAPPVRCWVDGIRDGYTKRQSPYPSDKDQQQTAPSWDKKRQMNVDVAEFFRHNNNNQGYGSKALSAPPPVRCWDDGIRDGYTKRQSPYPSDKDQQQTVPSWDKKRQMNVDVAEFFKHNSNNQGYGSKVNSWDGNSNSIDAGNSFNCQGWKRQRYNDDDDYDEDYDRGRMKKSKMYKGQRPQRFNSGRFGPNPFQRMHDGRSNGSYNGNGSQERLPFYNSKKGYNGYRGNHQFRGGRGHFRKNFNNNAEYKYHNASF